MRSWGLRLVERMSRLVKGTATLVPAILLAAAAWLVVRQIGWDSVAGLLANLAVLVSVVLTFLAWTFGFLARHHLLSTRAMPVRDWIEASGLPLVSAFGKLKRQ